MNKYCVWVFIDYPSFHYRTECGRNARYTERIKLQNKETKECNCPYCGKIIKNKKD